MPFLQLRTHGLPAFVVAAVVIDAQQLTGSDFVGWFVEDNVFKQGAGTRQIAMVEQRNGLFHL